MENVTEDPTNHTIQDFVNKTTGISPEGKLLITFNILTAITAFLGNVVIIVALSKASSLHPLSKLLFRSLASTDLCVGLITQPLYVTFLLMSPGHFRRLLLALRNYLTSTIFGAVSMFTMTAISVDRLLALLFDLRYRSIVTYKRVRDLLLPFWFSSSVIALMIFYNKAIAIGIATIGLLLSIVASTISYTKIYIALRQRQAQVQNYVQQHQPNASGISLNMARYRRTVSSALWVQITLLACYLPYATTIGIFAINGSLTQSLEIAWNVTLSLYYFNSTLNPFLYCWKIKAVRQAVKNSIRKLNCF